MTTTERNALILSVLPWTRSIVNACAGARPDREDIEQDAYVRLLQLASGYSADRGAPTTWAAMVTKSFLGRRLKMPAFSGPPPSPNGVNVEESRDHRAIDPAAEAERVEAVAAVRVALDRVRPADRRMVEARVLDGSAICDLDRTVSRERCSQKYRRAVNRCRQAFAALGLD